MGPLLRVLNDEGALSFRSLGKSLFLTDSPRGHRTYSYLAGRLPLLFLLGIGEDLLALTP